jgi:hypothetical protein
MRRPVSCSRCRLHSVRQTSVHDVTRCLRRRL